MQPHQTIALVTSLPASVLPPWPCLPPPLPAASSSAAQLPASGSSLTVLFVLLSAPAIPPSVRVMGGKEHTMNVNSSYKQFMQNEISKYS